MSSKYRFELDKSGVAQLLKEDVIPMLESKANEMAKQVGDCEVVIGHGTTRAWANVWTNADDNAPLKAMR